MNKISDNEYVFINAITHMENVGKAADEIDKIFNKYNMNQDFRPGEAISDHDLEDYMIQACAILSGNMNDHTEWIEWYLYEVHASGYGSDGLVTWMDEEGEEHEVYLTTPQALWNFLTKDFESYINDNTIGDWR